MILGDQLQPSALLGSPPSDMSSKVKLHHLSVFKAPMDGQDGSNHHQPHRRGNERRHKVSCTVMKMRLGGTRILGQLPQVTPWAPDVTGLWSTKQVCVLGPRNALS